jgi:hypothetical protein
LGYYLLCHGYYRHFGFCPVKGVDPSSAPPKSPDWLKNIIHVHAAKGHEQRRIDLYQIYCPVIILSLFYQGIS